MVKRFADAQHNTTSMEKSILVEISSQHLHELVANSWKFDLTPRLINPRACNTKVGQMVADYLQQPIVDARMATIARISDHEVVYAKDIAVYLQSPACIAGICEVSCFVSFAPAALKAVVKPLPTLDVQVFSSTVVVDCRAADCIVVDLDQLECACAHSRTDETVKVIVPSRLMGLVK